MKSIYLDKQTVSQVVQVLKEGGLVIFPSDTVYGALVDATNEDAVKKLIAFKNRPIGKPISIFVLRSEILEYVETKGHEALLHELLPGPFTIVLPSKHTVSKLLESERGTLGIRVPDYAFIAKLVEAFGRPITATSANLSGRSPHYSAESLLNELPKSKKDLIDLVVDAGTLPRNKPSTIIDLSGSTIRTLRKGDIVFTNSKTYLSQSPSQTQKIARHIVHRQSFIDNRPIVFIIQGELGSGKTVFVKGLGEALGIQDTIDSPTYIIYNEYPLPTTYNLKPTTYFYHFDLYNIEEKEELNHLGIEKMLEKPNILAFEWGDKSGDIIDLLKKKATIIYIHIKHKTEREREISVQY